MVFSFVLVSCLLLCTTCQNLEQTMQVAGGGSEPVLDERFRRALCVIRHGRARAFPQVSSRYARILMRRALHFFDRTEYNRISEIHFSTYSSHCHYIPYSSLFCKDLPAYPPSLSQYLFRTGARPHVLNCADIMFHQLSHLESCTAIFIKFA